MDLSTYYELTEKCIRDLGINPENCRGKKEGQWTITKGSASVWIDVVTINDSGYFQCMSPVSKVPNQRTEEFYQEVLEKNHALYGVGMTKSGDWIYVKTIRELKGLDASEIQAQIKRIGTYADDYDDYFKNKYFGGAGRDH